MPRPIIERMQLERLAEGFTSELFCYGAGRVLKLFRPAFVELAAAEFAILQRLHETPLAVPKPFGLVERDGRFGYAMQALEGPSLRDVLERDPTHESPCVLLADLHVAIHETPPLSLLPNLNERIAHRLRQGAHRLGDLGKSVTGQLTATGPGSCLCHNDLHFGNVLRHQGQLVTIDWNGAAVGNRHADVAKTLVLLEHAPVGVCLGPRAHALRHRIAESYAQAYCRHVRIDSGELDRWKVLRAAELVSLGVPFARGLMVSLRRFGLHEAEPG